MLRIPFPPASHSRLAALAWAAGCSAAMSAALSCSPDNPLPADVLDSAQTVDCTELTYESFAADFFAKYCLGCHNDQLTGDIARTDAPTGIDFNKLDGIRTFQKRIRLRAGEQGDMPPRLLSVPRPSESERLQLIRWIDCGTPTEPDVGR